MYRCECGKEFDEPNKFNGHKSICRIHLGDRYEKTQEAKRQGSIKGSKTNKERREKKRQEELEQWIKEQHRCESCGKIMTEKIRSGRFCSRSCANRHGRIKKEKPVKEKRQKKQIIREGDFACKYCGLNYKNHGALMQHIYHKHPEYENREDRLVKVITTNKEKVVLDITVKELEEYRKTHTKCEICGKSLLEEKKDDIFSRGFCKDHDHKTNKFRGLLCKACNRHLGWYEEHKENMERYLTK